MEVDSIHVTESRESFNIYNEVKQWTKAICQHDSVIATVQCFVIENNHLPAHATHTRARTSVSYRVVLGSLDIQRIQCS